MIELRVTKYDPAVRNAGHLYDEWTSVGDIGRAYRGVTLTEPEYQRVEDAYASAAVAFMQEAKVRTLKVASLENPAGVALPFGDGAILGIAEAESVVRRVLREEFWCMLEADGGFIHIGYDYYMHVGVRQPCPEAEALARKLGLFVERAGSPHRKQ